MAVNPLKLRLGACDSMILFGNTTGSVDLGASVGGAELNYNPTTFQVDVDQLILPAAAFKTKEEVTFDVALVQQQMNLAAVAFGYGSATTTDVTTTASGTLAAPSAGTVTVVGATGAATYTYEWVAFDSIGDSVPSSTFSTSTGNASLSTTNYNQVNAPTGGAVAGAVGYRLIRTVGGASQGLIGTFYGVTPPASVNDTGLTATAYSPAGSAPTMPNQDLMPFGGQVFIPTGTFDFSSPKNDGSLLHLRGHLNKVYSAKAIKLNFNREKHTEAAKLSLMALADTTQAQGKQAGYLIEEY